jgi:hypothetical protein
MTPTQYLTNKTKRTNTLFRFVNGKGFYISKGVEIPESEFHSMFPLSTKIRVPDASLIKREDIDSRRAWMKEY